MPVEQWLPVVGYEDKYLVSDHGRVRSLDRLDSIGRPIKGLLLQQFLSGAGPYPTVSLHSGKRKTVPVHSILAEAFLGPCPVGQEVCHNDDNKLNNHLSNLSYGTSSKNKLDMVRNGLHYWANKTECPRGHQYVFENLMPSKLKQGKRDCLACNRGRVRWKNAKENDLRSLEDFCDLAYQEILQ